MVILQKGIIRMKKDPISSAYGILIVDLLSKELARDTAALEEHDKGYADQPAGN